MYIPEWAIWLFIILIAGAFIQIGKTIEEIKTGLKETIIDIYDLNHDVEALNERVFPDSDIQD